MEYSTEILFAKLTQAWTTREEELGLYVKLKKQQLEEIEKKLVQERKFIEDGEQLVHESQALLKAIHDTCPHIMNVSGIKAIVANFAALLESNIKPK